tara:strand:+ start:250 stop:999 length:750 start_codon:yes stop_codon:yes gene_type:complete
MAKLGEYEFPEIGLSESIELGKKIVREFAGEVSRQGLARSLSMSQRGGAFSARLNALRLWGVGTGRSRVRVTKDGLRAVTPLSATEGHRARMTLARNVLLFVEMSNRLGDEPYGIEHLGLLLEELSGTGRVKVARKLTMIDRIFTEARPYLSLDDYGNTAEQSQAAGSALLNRLGESDSLEDEDDLRYADNSAVTQSRQGNDAYSQRIELVLPDGNLSLPETVGNLDAALAVLSARRRLVAAKESQDGY